MKTIDFRNLICFVVFYMCIFGVKIAGFFDLSMIMNGCILLANIRNIVIDYKAKRVFSIVFILFIYSFIIMLIFGTTHIVFSLKFVRVLCAIAGISTYIYKSKLDSNTLINTLINVLILHALIVIVESTVWLNLQNILKPITGFALLPMLYRGTGFTNGYDFAGILCNFGVLIVCHNDKKNIRFKFIKILIFISAIMLTSRFNMLLLIAMMFYMGYLDKSAEEKDRGFFRIISWIIAIPVIGIFLFSTNHFDNFFVNLLRENSFFSKIFDNLVYHYATTDLENTISDNFDFSNLSTEEMIFGKMIMANADPGYTQYIYAVGIVGLSMVFIVYFIIINDCIHNVYNTKMRRIILLVIVICLIMSLKNSYLLARHVTELLLILLYIGKYKMLEKKDV